MRLLERESQLRELHAACDEAASGRGRTMLVSGEAGIGKTSLVRRFADEVERSGCGRFTGACLPPLRRIEQRRNLRFPLRNLPFPCAVACQDAF